MSGCRSRSGGSRPQGVATPPKRRSERKSATQKPDSPAPSSFIKRSFSVKKIQPRKTLALNILGEKQSTPRVLNSTSGPRCSPTALNILGEKLSSPRVSNSTSGPQCSPRFSSKAGKENTEKTVKVERPRHSDPASSSFVQKQKPASSVPNSVLQSDPLGESVSSNVQFPIPDVAPLGSDKLESSMSKKVRRSYSRLEMSLYRSSFAVENHSTAQDDSSDTSTPNQSQHSRRSFFGFDNLLSQEVLDNVSPVVAKGEVRRESAPDVQVGTSLILSPREPDTNIPGIAAAKEKRKRRKIPQIDKSDLDEWAAQMNAQFDEAEKFDLFVE